MMKASKGIVAVSLVLGLMLSGLAFGYAADDILDFLPAFAKRARFGNAVTKPFFIVPGVSTPVTITAYIPDADLAPDSVQLKDGTAVIGNLTDTGNKVFSLTHNFQRDDGGAIKLSIAATFGAVNKTIAQFEIKVLSLPTLQDASLYNQNIDKMFSTLVTAKDNFSVLQDPVTTSGQSSIHLGLARERLLSVYANMEAIYRAETHSPSNFPRWTTFVPTYGGLLGSADSLLSDRELFKKNPYDPRVAHILAWAQATFPWDTYLSTPADRETAAWYYQTHGPEAPLQNTLKEANKVAIKQAGGQFTGLAGSAIGQLYGGISGWLTGKGINYGIGKTVDIFISQNGNGTGLLVGEIQDGEPIQVPAGSHDIIYSFGGALERAIGRNIFVTPDSTSTVNIDPGEIRGLRYSYRDLGTLGGNGATAQWINGNGQVVGRSDTISGPTHAFLWTPSGGMLDLDTLGGSGSEAYGINSNSQIVGHSETTSGSWHAFLWTQSSGMQDLGTLGGTSSFASSINSTGKVVGKADTTAGDIRAFLWDPAKLPSERMQNLGNLQGENGYNSIANSINDNGQVVGGSAYLHSFWGYLTNPFLWENGVMSLISYWWDHSMATGINNHGKIIGNLPVSVWMWNTAMRAFIWEHGTWRQLGTLSTDSYACSEAYSINDIGQVVGTTYVWPNYPYAENRAFFWQNDVIDDLNNMVHDLPAGVTLFYAYGINNSGQIVGRTQANRAFLLTPVP